MQLEMIRKFIESEEMAECFYDQYTKIDNYSYPWCRMITASRASLQDKIEALKLVVEKYPLDDDDEDDFCKPQILVESAVAALEETANTPAGSVFILGEYRRKDDWNTVHKEYRTPCVTFKKALEILKEKFETGDYSVATKDETAKSVWFDITRWDLNDNGIFDEAIIWDLRDYETICGFWINEDSKQIKDVYNSFWGSYEDPSFRVPYKSGDIVLIDMQPHFAPFPAVITNPEWEDMVDCCYPQVAYINKDGQLQTNALKHLPYKYPRYSPLYRLEKYTGDLDGKFEPLQVVVDLLTDPNLNNIKSRRAGTWREFVNQEQ